MGSYCEHALGEFGATCTRSRTAASVRHAPDFREICLRTLREPVAPAMASKVGIPILLTDICSLLFSNRELRRRRRLADLEDSSPSAASLKPKPPLPNVNLWYGPRVVPWADPEGRKPVWYYPHARGYHNCFLGELCDAIWLPNIALPCIFIFDVVRRSAKSLASDRSVIERALRRTLYGTTATFGILASLSLAGVEYRRPELIKRERCFTQEETICR